MTQMWKKYQNFAIHTWGGEKDKKLYQRFYWMIESAVSLKEKVQLERVQ